MFAIGVPELIIILVITAVVAAVPLVGVYFLGYNNGYRKALEKRPGELTKK